MDWRDAYRPVLFAVGSRCLLLLAGVASDAIFPDYDTSKSLRSHACEVDAGADARTLLQRALRAPVVWDAVYFDRIAQCGYEYEQYYAFFPGMPTILKGFNLISTAEGRAVTGLIVSNVAFVIAAAVFYRLTIKVVGDRRLAAAAVIFLCISPASVFLTYPYTEALFLLATMAGELLRLEIGSPLLAAAALTAGCFFRSNGMINAGFLLWHALGATSAAVQQTKPVVTCITTISCCLIGISCMFASLLLVFRPGYRAFCASAHWQHVLDPRPYCTRSEASLYAFVQSEYWGIGFLNYYQAKQIPNFLLAAPIATLAASALCSYAVQNPTAVLTIGNLVSPAVLPKVIKGLPIIKADQLKHNPGYASVCVFVYAAQLAGMLSIGLLFLHIQVLTRFLSSCPLLYWYAADCYLNGSRGRACVILLYFVCWAWVGIVLFPNFYPWT